ncbi:MAG: DUF3276 family protein [Chitinophagaceae bacterium]|nr:MAG: DUF3276 family protein [Chitinophagaceae bacterium]
MGNRENSENKIENIYSNRVRAGKRRTYFFDVRATRGNDYFLTITESRKRFDDNGYERHKIFIYKEDFNKFIKALGEAADYVKTELMPDFDFDAFNHENEFIENEVSTTVVPIVETISISENIETEAITETPSSENGTSEESVDKW